MENFTPYFSFAGGILIGLSATIMLLFNGRLTGISGIISKLFTSRSNQWPWRVAFLAGLIIGALSFFSLAPEMIPSRTDFPTSLLILAGFLVGFGTKLGSGCTSGHGICGIARLSPRSIIATLVFMFSGGVTVFIIRHIFGAEL